MSGALESGSRGSRRLGAGGIVMIPLAAVAVCMTVLVADRMLVLLRERRLSLRFYQQLLDLVKRHEFEQAERALSPLHRHARIPGAHPGLLGTVTGIIRTFDMIRAVGTGNSRMMAGGISEALITTGAGLIIAIPGLLAHSFLTRRVNAVIADAERFAAMLANVLREQGGSGAAQSVGRRTGCRS